MTASIFLIVATICSIITSLVTEAVKKLVKKDLASNIVVLILSAIIGGATTIIYYIFNNIPFTLVNDICIVLMVIANFLTATVGYDKVKQAIEQIISCKKGE